MSADPAATDRNDSQAWMTSAGGVVGLIALTVAALYVLGGLIFALRLALDGSSISEAVALVGQLPREYLITASLVEVFGVALLVGLAAGVTLAIYKPEPLPDKPWPSLKYQLGGKVKTWRALCGLGLALTVPALLPLLEEDRQSWLEWLCFFAAWMLSWGAACIGWAELRDVFTRYPKGSLKERRNRALLGGAIWIGMALPGAVLFASFVELEHARVCLSDGGSVTGRLVVDTKDAVLLTREVTVTTDQVKRQDQAVLRIPAAQVTQVDFGARQITAPACPS